MCFLRRKSWSTQGCRGIPKPPRISKSFLCEIYGSLSCLQLLLAGMSHSLLVCVCFFYDFVVTYTLVCNNFKGLPSTFCVAHLPEQTVEIVLEDENGKEYEAVYIGKRSGISGGWRGFALDHKLDDGDALIFHLVEPTRFKVCFLNKRHVLELGVDILTHNLIDIWNVC